MSSWRRTRNYSSNEGETMTFKCIKCGVHPLVFDGSDEYEPHPDTGEKYCFSCAMEEFPEHICGD